MPYKIFVSYDSKHDKQEMLSLKGLIDQSPTMKAIILTEKERNRPHKSFPSKVAEGIDECDMFMPILTKESIRNQWVNQEIGYAFAKDKDFCALVEKDLREDLSGFIHRESDLPFTFCKPTTDNDMASFNKCVQEALSHISEEKIHIGQMLGPYTNSRHTPVVDIFPKISVNKDLRFKAKLRRIHPETQTAIAYYQLYNPANNERLWIGFKLDNESMDELRNSSKESLKIIKTADREYDINETVFDTLRERGIRLKNSTKLIIDRVRIRGCNKVNEPVEFFFGFLEK
jgi:nucleoside 2-deoxyribosyltransferase